MRVKDPERNVAGAVALNRPEANPARGLDQIGRRLLHIYRHYRWPQYGITVDAVVAASETV